MKKIDGKKIASEILKNLENKIKESEVVPGLAIVLIGEDKASELYANLKEKAAKEVGMNFYKFLFSENEEEENIIAQIEELNNDQKINGIIVQLPLPEKFNTEKIINSIACEKDADGFRENSHCEHPIFPLAIIKMLKSTETEIKNVVIITKSHRFGKSMQEIIEKNGIAGEYVLCDDMENKDLKKYDAIVSACGIPGLIKSEMVKDDAVIIDGGIKKVQGRTLGDVDIKSFENTSCRISPVPGGVGPVTVASLLESVYKLSKK